jgi:hypothetical protein
MNHNLFAAKTLSPRDNHLHATLPATVYERLSCHCGPQKFVSRPIDRSLAYLFGDGGMI